jgi:Ca2+-binding RTX toxin-like protein
MTTTPVSFYGINAAPPFNGPLTISETTPGDVNTASFFDASNNPVNQGFVLGQVVQRGYVEIGEIQPPNTDYFFLDGRFLGNSSDSTVGQVLTDLYNAYINDIVNGGNNTAQLAIDDAAIEAARLGVPVSTINEPFFDSAGHLVQTSAPVMLDAVAVGHGLTRLTGTAQANSDVSIFDGDKLVGTVTAAADGTWSLQANIKGSAVHSFTETSTLGSHTALSAGVTLYTPAANKSLQGGSGNDVLIGGPNDTLTGGGGSDTFVFNPSFGKETVKDFNVGQDVLSFDHTLFANATASQVLSQTHDSKAGAVIVVDAHDTVTLTGVTVAQLQAAQQAHVDWLHFFPAPGAHSTGPSDGGTLGPVNMLDPGPSSGGLGPVSMLDPGPVNTMNVTPKLFQSV